MGISLIATIFNFIEMESWENNSLVKYCCLHSPPERVQGMSVSYPRDRSHPPFFSKHPTQPKYTFVRQTSKKMSPHRAMSDIAVTVTTLIEDLLVCFCVSDPIVCPDCWYLVPPCFFLGVTVTPHFTLIGLNHADSRILDLGHSKWQSCRPRQKWKQNQPSGWVYGMTRGRENKSRDATKERWEKWGGGIWKEGVIK